MLKIIFNIASQNNITTSKDNNFFKIITESDSSQSVFNKLNKYLLSKEIYFNNVFTEEKKKYNDKSILCSNFVINNLLNIVNKKDIHVDSIKNNKIQKKTEEYKNTLLDNINFFIKNKNIKTKKNQEILKTLDSETFLNPAKTIKNRNHSNDFHQLNDIYIINNLYLKPSNDQNFARKRNFCDVNKNDVNLIQDRKKIISVSDIKKNQNNLLLSQNTNKINNIANRQNSFKTLNQKESIQSHIEPLILNDSKKSTEWKKLISNKILLSISNRDNQAEIHLKPESLGSIYIVINMKHDFAKLKFISKYNEVRVFLNNYMPFLRNSLIKNGIKLKEFNILSSLPNQKLKNNKKIFDKKNCDLNLCKKNIDIYNQRSDLIQYKTIDVYI